MRKIILAIGFCVVITTISSLSYAMDASPEPSPSASATPTCYYSCWFEVGNDPCSHKFTYGTTLREAHDRAEQLAIDNNAHEGFHCQPDCEQ